MEPPPPIVYVMIYEIKFKILVSAVDTLVIHVVIYYSYTVHTL